MHRPEVASSGGGGGSIQPTHYTTTVGVYVSLFKITESVSRGILFASASFFPYCLHLNLNIFFYQVLLSFLFSCLLLF